MKIKVFSFVLALSAFLVLTVAQASVGAVAKGCSVTITHPRSGQDVGGHVKVAGTATIPPNHELWVFARHKSFRTSNEWWAQGKASAQSGPWELDATIGESRDIGSDFDVSAAIFDRSQVLTLTSHFEANRKLKMPPAACVGEVYVVRKTSDD